MVSAASTVTVFFNPETERLAQWPVITTLFEMPLTVTMLSLHTIDLFSPTPVTVSVPPGGGKEGAGPTGEVGPVGDVGDFEGPGLRGKLVITDVLGSGDTA